MGNMSVSIQMMLKMWCGARLRNNKMTVTISQHFTAASQAEKTHSSAKCKTKFGFVFLGKSLIRLYGAPSSGLPYMELS